MPPSPHSGYKVFLYFDCWCHHSIVIFYRYSQFLYQILPVKCSGTFQDEKHRVSLKPYLSVP